MKRAGKKVFFANAVRLLPAVCPYKLANMFGRLVALPNAITKTRLDDTGFVLLLRRYGFDL